MALDFVAGCIGGGAGVLVGHPLDTVKVRLQIQDSKNPQYVGTYNTFMKIFKQEGIKGLYSGVNSPLAGMAFINAIVFGVYGNTMNAIKKYTKENKINMTENREMLAVGTSGSVAGLAQVVVCSPVELAKIRLQIDKDRKNYKSISDCLIKVFKKDGTRGLFKGFNITCVREVPSFFVYFYVYELLLKFLGTTLPCMMISGGIAGCSSWASVYPIDVIKTRIQMDGISAKPKYRNSWHCFKTSMNEEGYKFLFKGLNSTLARAFPVNAVTFTTVHWILKLNDYY